MPVVAVGYCFILFISEAFLIATPFYGGIIKDVHMYGRVKLVYAYLDSQVRKHMNDYHILESLGVPFSFLAISLDHRNNKLVTSWVGLHVDQMFSIGLD